MNNLNRIDVQLAKVFLIIQLVISICLCMLVYPLIRYFRITKRNMLSLEKGRLRIQIGRIFVLDEEYIPLSAIDNIKVDNSLLGSIFNYSRVGIVTRTETYEFNGFDKKQSKLLLNAYLDEIDKR